MDKTFKLMRNGIFVLFGILLCGQVLAQTYEMGGTYTNATGSFSLRMDNVYPQSPGFFPNLIEEFKSGVLNRSFTNASANAFPLSNVATGNYEYKLYFELDLGPELGYSKYHFGSTWVNVGASTPPSVPSSITFSGLSHAATSADNNGSFNVNWGSASNNLTSYQLYQRVNSGSWSQVYNSTGQTLSRNLANGTYEYRVRACNGAGCSSYSSIISVQVIKSPGAVAAISGPSQDTDGTFSLSWGAASGSVTSYQVQRMLSGGSWALVQNTSAQARSESNLAEGSYSYRVRACNSLSCAASWSPTKSILNYKKPNTPAAINGPNTDPDGNFQLSWSPVNNAVVINYELQRSVAGSDWGSVYSGNSLSKNESLASGVYGYRVRACGGIECSDWSAAKIVEVGYQENQSEPPAQEPLLSGDSRVGVVNGSYSVGQSGGLMYSVAISSPSGIGGMQPNVSLTYSSGGGNGPMGMGWQIGGTSNITRCPSNWDFGGDLDGIDFDNKDKFCLDGQPLVAVSGQYGANGTEYRTQAESFLRITSYGSVGSCARDGANVKGPSWFNVETPNGKTIEYGRTSDSRVELVGCSDVIQWAVNKEYDKFSNAVDYVYSETQGEHLITRIDYNGGDSSIRFNYIARPDTMQGYMLGSTFQATKILSQIEVYESAYQLREYNLAYTSSSAISNSIPLLASIEECAANECLNPTVFEWSDTVLGFEAPQAQTHSSQLGGRPVHSDWGKYEGWGDFNGDGIQDRAWIPAHNSNTYVALGSPDGLQSPTVWMYANSGGVPSYAYEGINVAYVDMNGDGRDDKVWAPNGRYDLWVALSTGSGFATPTQWATPVVPLYSDASLPQTYMDMNGDGRADKVWVPAGRNQLWIMLSNGASFDAPTIWLNPMGSAEGTIYPTTGGFHTNEYVDLNGDGLPDKVWTPYGKNSLWVAINKGNSFAAPTKWMAETPHNVTSYYRMHDWYVDVNGDGLNDKVWVPYGGPGHLMVGLNTGTSFAAATIWMNASHTPWTTSRNVNSYVDLNNDGKADKIWMPNGSSHISVSYSTGTSFTAPQVIMTSGSLGMNTYSLDGIYDQYIDVTGDGFPDKVWIPYGNSGTHFYVATSKNKPIEIISVTDGHGVQTKFTSEFMTDPDIYTPHSVTPAYPEQNYAAPMRLVSKVETTNAVGGFDTTSYSYESMRIHLLGKGSAGFSKVITTDESTGLVDEVTYSQNFDNRSHGLPLSTISRAPNNVVLAQTWNENFVNQTWGSGNSYRYKPGARKSTAISRDLNGDFLSKSVMEHITVDAYGNSTSSRTRIYDESDVVVNTVSSTSVVENDTSNWFIGRVTRTEATTQIYGQPPTKKVIALEYDPFTNKILAKKNLHPQTDLVITETRFGEDENGNTAIDQFGNDLAVTLRGPNFQSRTTKVEYDPSGRRIIKNTNPVGQSATISYYGNGTPGQSGAYPNMPSTTTSLNGVQSRTEYDNFGRVVKQSAAWGTPTQVDSGGRLFFCDYNCPLGALYYSVGWAEGGAQTYSYFNKLGLLIRKSQETIAMVGAETVFVNIDYKYDDQGRTSEVSEPYYEGDSPTKWTVTEYDLLDRVTKLTHHSGRIDTTSYLGYVTESRIDINGKNQLKRAVKNAIGLLVTATDDNWNDLNYVYNSNGSLLSVTDPDGNVITTTYDVLGRKLSITDPSKGVWSYTYNGLGELITQTNGRSEVMCFAYDTLGRKIKQVDFYQGEKNASPGAVSEATSQCSGDASNTNVATWQYDTAVGGGKGKLHQINGANGYNVVMSYNSLGAPISTTETINGRSYVTSATYDTLNRPSVVRYPGASNRLGVRTFYNAIGMPVSVRNADNNALYYELKELNERGQTVYESFGNGVRTVYGYDQNGLANQIGSFRLGSASYDVQDEAFTFDDIGNLEYRHNHRLNYEESFAYDNLNRLTQVTSSIGGMENRVTDITYNALGNITSKTGVGAYRYGSQCATDFGPHAVCQITGTKNTTYQYDLSGNMTAGDGRIISYGILDKPTRIQKGSTTTDITYGPSRSRYFRKDTVGSSVTEYTYVGGYELVEFKSNGTTINKVEERHYIGGFAVVTMENRGSPGATNYTRFLHKDHLGSVTSITDEVGNVVEEHSFDAWGKRRAPSLAELQTYLSKPWSAMNANEKGNYVISSQTLASAITNRGYTGHEQMDGVGLIHMNGRVYDPEIGRMIQADPFIPVVTDLQAFDRYAYVRNNPLSLTDPSGYSWVSKHKKRMKQFIRKAAKVHLPGFTVVDIYSKVRYWDMNNLNNDVIRVRKNLPLSRWIDDRLRASQRTRVMGAYVMEAINGACLGFCTAAYAAHLTMLRGGDGNDIQRASLTYMDWGKMVAGMFGGNASSGSSSSLGNSFGGEGGEGGGFSVSVSDSLILAGVLGEPDLAEFAKEDIPDKIPGTEKNDSPNEQAGVLSDQETRTVFKNILHKKHDQRILNEVLDLEITPELRDIAEAALILAVDADESVDVAGAILSKSGSRAAAQKILRRVFKEAADVDDRLEVINEHFDDIGDVARTGVRSRINLPLREEVNRQKHGI